MASWRSVRTLVPMRNWRSSFAAPLLLAFIIAAGCDRAGSHRSVEIATTTSLEGSGLLVVLQQAFLRDSDIELHPFVVGSGLAMRLAEQGEVSLIITHDPAAEHDFVRRMHPLIYRQFMWNDFVIVGPHADPAHVRSATSAVDAFSRIFQSRSRFCSRNDESATNTRELALWRAAGIEPVSNRNYLRMGQPMAHLLRSTNALNAYTLSDRATFDRLSHVLNLEVVFGGDPILKNIYSVTLLRPVRRTRPRELQDAERFAQWLLSDRGRDVIAHYEINGRVEFHLVPEAPKAP
jgi:tungstate transport system substrate-binding protein